MRSTEPSTARCTMTGRSRVPDSEAYSRPNLEGRGRGVGAPIDHPFSMWRQEVGRRRATVTGVGRFSAWVRVDACGASLISCIHQALPVMLSARCPDALCCPFAVNNVRHVCTARHGGTADTPT